MPAPSQSLIRRPPVVVVMGHIDHGKSKLLDYIRQTNVVESEFGGITQHISAYEVAHKRQDGSLQKITFLDTPGHEAFQKMRARGAAVADIAILVVSAEDGVKPQTIEAYQAITEADIPFVVAINKIDKPNADIEKTKKSLAENNIFIEGYGGSIPAVAISAKTGENIPELLEMILLVSDMEELTGNPALPAEGVVIESSLDERRGNATTLIIKNGTLKSGQCLVAGGGFSQLLMMEDFSGKKITEATFSSPVSVTGWGKLPPVGATFTACESKKAAEEAAAAHKEAPRATALSIPLSEEVLVIPLIIKTDVAGTADAIPHEIQKIQTEKVFLKVLKAEAGNIGENEVKTALACPGSIIIGFNVKVDSRARDLAERSGVLIKTFNVIYKMSQWLSEIVASRTPKRIVEETSGSVKILKLFSQNKDKQIVGGKIISGTVAVGNSVKIMRRENDLGRGEVLEVQQSRSKVREASEGECGLLVEAKVSIAPGDILQSVVTVEK